MGLQEVQEDLKKQIEEAKKAEENPAENEVNEDKKEEVKEEIKEEEKKEEAKAEEPKKEKTNADFARERRERLSEQQKLREELAAANARIEEMQKAYKKESAPVDAEPNRDEDPTGWADWRARQVEKKVKEVEAKAQEANEKLAIEERQRQKERIIQQANNEMLAYEESVKQAHPDYEEAKKYYVNMLAFSLKNLNPKMTNEALANAVNNQLLLTASQYLNDGHENPVQAIYDSVKALGFNPQPKEVPAEEIKPDMAKVAKNRERNAGMAASAGGTGKGELTKQYAATELTSAEWAKLPVAERQRILKQM